jgi:hypothetical protein
VLRALKELWGDGRDLWIKAKTKPLIEALRTVYFPSSGSLSLLRKVAVGEHVSADEATAVLVTYGAQENAVQESLERLSFDHNFRTRVLGLNTIRDLDAVAYGKITVRQSVRYILERISHGHPVVQQDVADLVEMIEKLNTTVSELDAALNK